MGRREDLLKKLTILLLAVALIFTLGCSDNNTSAPTGMVPGVAKLEITETDFDFGYSPQNSKIVHTFWLHSTGTAPVEIYKIVPG